MNSLYWIVSTGTLDTLPYSHRTLRGGGGGVLGVTGISISLCLSIHQNFLYRDFLRYCSIFPQEFREMYVVQTSGNIRLVLSVLEIHSSPFKNSFEDLCWYSFFATQRNNFCVYSFNTIFFFIYIRMFVLDTKFICGMACGFILIPAQGHLDNVTGRKTWYSSYMDYHIFI